MATAYAAIVIDDDDDEDEDENDVPDIAVSEKETKINTLIEILNLSRDQSESALEAAGFNLKVAISAKLDHNPSRPTAASSSSSKNVVQRSLISQPVRGNAPQNKILEKGLSSQWHSCFQNAPTPFVDLGFPPTRTSLDGRSTAIQSTTVISCYCQLPATSRTVQTDGPNYGRFYLACGRSSFNRRQNDKATSEKFEYKPCVFFQWDKDGSLGGYSNTRWSQLSWHAFVGPKYVVYRKGMGLDQVRQGAVGNCWFLSALAVVAEKAYLIEKVFPHCTTNDKGCYQVNLCLDGKWAPVMVDAHLPVVLEESTAKPKSLQKQDFRGVALQHGKVAFPAFCAIPQGQLWPALVEKAYAKAHGSYANLSGGFIAEGLADLTGAPFETILFEAHDNHDGRDELWARLLSFSEAGFLMGVATSSGGDGLVGSHAYSVLKVQEIHGSMVGSQQKMTDFFVGSTSKKAKLDVGASQEKNTVSSTSHGRGETIRLIRIRNPWGKKEWQGAFSTHSETWTKRLRKELGKEAWAQNDGTFWMSYDDVLTRFHHMDVCKTREGWVHISIDGCFDASRDILHCSKYVYTIRPSKQTWAFMSLVQPKKRANTSTRYWYSDLSMILLKRLKDSDDEWNCETVSLYGVTRRSDVEVFLDPSFEYCLLPFAGVPKQTADSRFNFRLTVYSSNHVEVQSYCKDLRCRQVAMSALHTNLLNDKGKVILAVASEGLLLCVQRKLCLYFIGVNASSIQFLSLLLTIELGNGTLLTFGKNDDTHDVAPKSQKILLVVSSTGKQSSTTKLKFKYVSDILVVERSSTGSSASKKSGGFGFGSQMAISGHGECLAANRSACFSNKGSGTVDIFSWIPQVGSTRL